MREAFDAIKNNSINNSINTLMLNINRILYFACKYNKLNYVSNKY